MKQYKILPKSCKSYLCLPDVYTYNIQKTILLSPGNPRVDDNTSIALSNNQLSDHGCEIRALKMVTKWSANYKGNGIRNTDRKKAFFTKGLKRLKKSKAIFGDVHKTHHQSRGNFLKVLAVFCWEFPTNFSFLPEDPSPHPLPKKFGDNV